jgi:hypothetical protein
MRPGDFFDIYDRFDAILLKVIVGKHFFILYKCNILKTAASVETFPHQVKWSVSFIVSQ